MANTFAPLALVIDAKAACRVLSDRQTFGVHDYDRKMQDAIGRFFLGLDYEDPEYRAQLGLWHETLGAADADLVRRYARAAATETRPSADGASTVDVVDWTARTLERFVDAYFGIPRMASGNGHRGLMLELCQRTSSYIFNIDLLKGHLKDSAQEAGRLLEQHLCETIAHRRARGPRPDGDVVDRLLAGAGAGHTPKLLATVLAGTLSGLFVPTSSQFVNVVDLLLDLPFRDLDVLRAAARAWAQLSPEEREHRDDLVARYVLEAARFDPFPMGLVRRCPDGATLEGANGKTATIPSGATVVAMMRAVALDPQLASTPNAFLIGRPPGHYVLFGAGQHRCLGATPEWPIATALMTEMATALFGLPGLRRAPGRRGTVQLRDAWPVSFELVWDAAPAEDRR